MNYYKQTYPFYTVAGFIKISSYVFGPRTRRVNRTEMCIVIGLFAFLRVEVLHPSLQYTCLSIVQLSPEMINDIGCHISWHTDIRNTPRVWR